MKPVDYTAFTTVCNVRWRLLRLNRDGYTTGPNPQYYGTGLPLYRFFRVDPSDGSESVICELRGRDRVDARERFEVYARGRQMGRLVFWSGKRKVTIMKHERKIISLGLAPECWDYLTRQVESLKDGRDQADLVAALVEDALRNRMYFDHDISDPDCIITGFIQPDIEL